MRKRDRYNSTQEILFMKSIPQEQAKSTGWTYPQRPLPLAERCHRQIDFLHAAEGQLATLLDHNYSFFYPFFNRSFCIRTSCSPESILVDLLYNEIKNQRSRRDGQDPMVPPTSILHPNQRRGRYHQQPIKRENRSKVTS